jgi:hypothetical protein
VPRGRQSAEPLWRALAVFRFACLGYAVLLTAVINRAQYARLGWAARDIHDSVLQVLAMVQRRGAEAGGAAAELGRLAGQQEAALRSLIGGQSHGIGKLVLCDRVWRRLCGCLI